MLPVRDRAYRLFDLMLMGISLVILCFYFLLRLYRPSAEWGINISIFIAILAAVHIIYSLALYPITRRRSVVAASLLGSTIFGANLAGLVLTTGGFSSAYYALWLLFIIGVGIYKPSVPLGVLALTTLYFGSRVYTQAVSSVYLADSIISLITTYISATLGFWLWHTHHTKMKDQKDVKELANQLNQEQFKADVLIRHIGEGVMVVDLQSRVQLVNPAAEGLTGWDETEAKGIDSRLVLQLADEMDHPLNGETHPLVEVFKKRQSVRNDDLIMISRSGKRLAISLIASPLLSKDGSVAGQILDFKDISQAKATERQRSEFISTASHEMRTPLAAVEGYIALAMNPKVGKIDDKAQVYLTKAQDAIHHLGELFQDLLATSRIEEGKLPSNPELVEVGSLVKLTIGDFRLKSKQKGLTLSLVADADSTGLRNLQPLYYSYVDPDRIREVLANLVDNAIKFTSQGGVRVSLSADSKYVTVNITDTGVGIAPEDIKHLFQKFYRVDNSATRNIGGTGLGLYICRAIVEMYGGHIGVRSQLGVGTTFAFTLPRMEAAKVEQLLSRINVRHAAPTLEVSEITAKSMS